MNEQMLESWMHASEEERIQMQQGWNTDSNDGENIASAIANLFADECVYNVVRVKPVLIDRRWQLNAYVEAGDFDTLKDRYNVEFLGLKVNFSHINDYQDQA